MDEKIFIDGGAHLFEGLQHFSELYNIDQSWSVVSFEANPDIYNSPTYRRNLKELQLKTNISVFNKALGDSNKISKFIAPLSAQGSIMGSIDNYHQLHPDSCKTSEVEEISLAGFIKNNFRKEDYIICKLDIEGAEFKVVKDLIDTNTIEYINDIYVEWHHDNTYGHQFPETYSAQLQQQYLQSRQQLEQLSQEGKIKYTEWF